MGAGTVRKPWRVLVASLTAAMILPFVGSGVAYGLPTDSASRVDGDHGMRGAYSVRGLGVTATTTASFLVPNFDPADCGPTDSAWVERRVYRHTQVQSVNVQIWTTCDNSRGWWVEDGAPQGVPSRTAPRGAIDRDNGGLEPRDADHGAQLDRGWVDERTWPSPPTRGGYTVFANHVWDGDLPFLEHASFTRLQIDGRPLGEYDTRAFRGRLLANEPAPAGRHVVPGHLRLRSVVRSSRTADRSSASPRSRATVTQGHKTKTSGAGCRPSHPAWRLRGV